jgi:hypothetical protein
MSFDLGVHAWMHGDVLWNVTYFPLDATMNKERTKLQREKMCHATQVSGVCCKTCCILIGTNANILLLYAQKDTHIFDPFYVYIMNSYSSFFVWKMAGLYIQGEPEALERFREAKSQEPLGLQKRHRCQKMRLILNFCPEM